jgi:protein TonB
LSFITIRMRSLCQRRETALKLFVCLIERKEDKGGTTMFDQLIESKKGRNAARRWKYFAMTAMVWMTTIATVIIAGIFAVDASIGEPVDIISIAIPPPPPLPPKGPSGDTPRRQNNQQPPPGMFAVDKTPTEVVPPQPRDLSFGFHNDSSGNNNGGVPGGVPNGVDNGVPGGLPAAPANTAPPPPVPKPIAPPKDETPTPAQKQVVRSQILQGSAIRRAQPTYPALAITAGIQDSVVVEVMIDEQGNVASARVLSGHMMLREVSLNAARQWKWNPTLLNGTPVKVIGTITFKFQK